MNQPIRTAMAVLMALVITTLGSASKASATTLEIGGVAQNKSVSLETTFSVGGSFLITDTSTVIANTCTSSALKGSTSSPFSGSVIAGPFTSMSWTNCTEGNPTVDAAGSFIIERIGATTNGTVRWTGTKVTVPSPFGPLTCTTSNTDIGTFTGVASTSAHGIIDVSAVIACTVIGTARWTGQYLFTVPTGLGVTG